MNPQLDSKVVFCAYWQTLAVRGYRRFFVELAQLLKNGEVHLLVPDQSLELGLKKINAEPASQQELSLLSSIQFLPTWILHVQIFLSRGLFRAFRKIFSQHPNTSKYALILAEPYSITALWVYFWMKLTARDAKPIFFALQNINKPMNPVLTAIERFLFKRSFAICSLGSEQTEVLRARGYSGHVIPFPLWYDPELFHPGETRIEENSRVRIGYAGSLTEEKGVPDLLKTLDEIDTEVDFLVAGAGTVEIKISNPRVHVFRKGHVAYSEMGDFFRNLDILVVPSRTEPHWKEQFGRIIIEAKACGVTVLGSTSGAIQDVINDQNRIFQERNSEDLTRVLKQWIRKLADSSPLRASIRVQNHSEVSLVYTAAACAKRFLRNLEI